MIFYSVLYCFLTLGAGNRLFDIYSKPKVTLQFLLLNSFQDLSEQISGQLIHASVSTIELSVLTLKTNDLYFFTNSSVDQGLGNKILKTVDCQ